MSATTLALETNEAPPFGPAVTGLVCRQCGKDHAIEASFFCDLCFGPLEVTYDYDYLRGRVSRERIEAGPDTIWRYADLLPATEPRHRVDLGAGWTPLRPAPRLAAELGLKKLWLKLDLANPTYSFKDRVVSVALSVARQFGFKVVGCASTGNLANSVAAHAAGHGLRSIVFIPSDLEAGKVAASTVYGGEVIAIEGSYDDVNRLCVEAAAAKGWAFVNVNLRPYYAEGSKTLGFEVAEQLGWRTPDALVAPIASGAMLTKVGKGLRELDDLGLIDESRTRLYGAQAEGCSPVAKAFDQGQEDVLPVKPATIAKSLAIGDPGDGHYVLKATRETGGAVHAVKEERVVEGIRLLARTEGIFTEGAGGVTVSVLEELVAQGRISPNDETVALITGSGVKTIETLGEAGPTATIRPDLDQLDQALREKGGVMSITIKIPAQLRTLTDGSGEIQVGGATVGAALTELNGRYSGLGERLFDEEGKLRRFVNVYVGDEDIRFTKGLDTELSDGQKVTIIPAVAGG